MNICFRITSSINTKLETIDLLNSPSCHPSCSDFLHLEYNLCFTLVFSSKQPDFSFLQDILSFELKTNMIYRFSSISRSSRAISNFQTLIFLSENTENLLMIQSSGKLMNGTACNCTGSNKGLPGCLQCAKAQ